MPSRKQIAAREVELRRMIDRLQGSSDLFAQYRAKVDEVESFMKRRIESAKTLADRKEIAALRRIAKWLRSEEIVFARDLHQLMNSAGHMHARSREARLTTRDGRLVMLEMFAAMLFDERIATSIRDAASRTLSGYSAKAELKHFHFEKSHVPKIEQMITAAVKIRPKHVVPVLQRGKILFERRRDKIVARKAKALPRQ
jgi:hypothetical protein